MSLHNLIDRKHSRIISEFHFIIISTSYTLYQKFKTTYVEPAEVTHVEITSTECTVLVNQSSHQLVLTTVSKLLLALLRLKDCIPSSENGGRFNKFANILYLIVNVIASNQNLIDKKPPYDLFEMLARTFNQSQSRPVATFIMFFSVLNQGKKRDSRSQRFTAVDGILKLDKDDASKVKERV